MLETMLTELRQEAEITRRVLDRVPDEKLTWRPHPKSMTIGQLALHVATIPGAICGLSALSEFDAANATFEPPQPESKDALMKALGKSVEDAVAYLESLSAESAAASWRLLLRGNEVFAMPRVWMLRNLLLNHWYHHRGQLSVYLRLLDVPVPVIYGRSADENPFA